MKKIWREERKKDPAYGTGKNRARVDKSLVRKFIQAVRDKKVRPYDDPEHCLICVIFILGYYCALRGSSDCEMVFIGEYQTEDGPDLAGLKWGGIKVPFSKTNQLNMSNTRLPVDEDVLLTFVEDPTHDCFDPFAIFCHYLNHVHPGAKKFYGRLVRQGEKYEGGRLEKQFGRPVWYVESGHGRSNWNLGSNKHRELCKRIAFLAGVDKWENCTGHSLRALCITTCIAKNLTAVEIAAKVRHASLNSQKDYASECTERKANRVLALQNEPVGGKKRSRSPPKAEPIPENGVIVQTQPMLPQNRAKLLHAATKKPRVEEEDEKENFMVSADDSELGKELKKLQMQNEILRLKKENQKMESELTRSNSRSRSPPPRRHGRSYPPTYHPDDRSPLDDRHFAPRSRDDGYRRSYPPTNHHRHYSPPRYYEDRRRDYSDYHGGYSDDEHSRFDSHYHRR